MSGDALLVLVVVLVLVGLLAMLGLVIGQWVRWRSALKPRTRVVVNLRDDVSIEGVLWQSTPRQIVIRDAVVHEGPAAARADGEIVVDRDHVRFVQVSG